MLPKQAILRQESHPERTTQAVPFVLPYDVDLAIEDQVEIILSRLFGVTVDSVRISFDLDSPVLIVQDQYPVWGLIRLVCCQRRRSFHYSTANTVNT